MIQAVLFDIDGTLVNSLGNYLQAYKEILKYYGFSFPDDKVVKMCFGRTEEAICKDLALPEKAEEFRNMYFAAVREALPSLELFPGTLGTLSQLTNDHIKTGLITFAHDWYVQDLSRLFSLDQYVEVAISFNDVQNAKPNPEAVIKACEILGIKAHEALVVGDSKGDIMMGKNAGSKTALYTPEENKNFYNFEELEFEIQPDFVITHLAEVVDLVKQIR